MSLIDTARDALKDLPVSDIVRERLSLALDRLLDAESKIEALQAEKGSLHGQLERECGLDRRMYKAGPSVLAMECGGWCYPTVSFAVNPDSRFCRESRHQVLPSAVLSNNCGQSQADILHHR